MAMKALYSIFIAIVAGALLVGCGKSTGPAANTNAPAPLDNLAALKQAVQQFNTGEGHYPRTLDALVPKYIAKIPDAPGGYKYAYNPSTGEVRVSR
jgi:ABC-type glycerol-3-phosphate transport system substrate-binding protein